MGWIVFPPNSCDEVLIPSTSEWAAFGGRAFKEVITVKWVHLGGPESVWLVFLERESVRRTERTNLSHRETGHSGKRGCCSPEPQICGAGRQTGNSDRASRLSESLSKIASSSSENLHLCSRGLPLIKRGPPTKLRYPVLWKPMGCVSPTHKNLPRSI